jgi:hypothetical protein
VVLSFRVATRLALFSVLKHSSLMLRRAYLIAK